MRRHFGSQAKQAVTPRPRVLHLQQAEVFLHGDESAPTSPAVDPTRPLQIQSIASEGGGRCTHMSLISCGAARLLYSSGSASSIIISSSMSLEAGAQSEPPSSPNAQRSVVATKLLLLLLLLLLVSESHQARPSESLSVLRKSRCPMHAPSHTTKSKLAAAPPARMVLKNTGSSRSSSLRHVWNPRRVGEQVNRTVLRTNGRTGWRTSVHAKADDVAPPLSDTSGRAHAASYNAPRQTELLNQSYAHGGGVGLATA